MLFNIFFLAFTLINVFVIFCSYGLETQSTYVVFMDGQKMEALEASLETSKTWHEEILESISISNQDDDQYPYPQLHYSYDTIIPAGFSAKLTKQQLESLRGVDGFVSAIKDELRTLQTTHSPQFLGLHDGHGLWSAQNLASDVIIGVVDSGIWPEHPSFNDLGLSSVPSRWKGKKCETGTNFRASSNCNKKLIGAAVFFKAYESDNGRINETSDYRSARDSDGHGTHTASTAGGNVMVGANLLGRAKGNAAGMRPTARIAAYKACFENGCYDSDIIAAMDQAVKDGVDILSISVGSSVSLPFYDDGIAIGAFGAIRSGVIVSTSAGNSGPNSSTVTNVAPWLTTVAASTTDRSFPARVHLGDGQNFKGTSLCSGKPTKSLSLVYNETNRNATLCKLGSLSPSLVKGKIVICLRGDNARVAKGEAVKAAGGAGMILANDKGNGEELVADAHVLPALALGFSEGNAVINYAKSSSRRSPTATIVFQGDVFGIRAPVMASFSSRGPNPVDPKVLKPDVTAPGVNILAAWPPNVSPTGLKSDNRSGLFNIISGTSMSCPQVSGLMALLKSLRPDWSPAAIKSALMTTAYVYDSEKKPISDGAAVSNVSESANPFVFGSGHVDPERAADPGLIYDISTQDYLNYLLCGLRYNSKQMAHFTGKVKPKACPANSNIRHGDHLNYPSFSVVFSRDLTGTTTYMRTVTNVGIGVSTYSVKVIEPKGVCITVQPNVLKFGKMGEKLGYNVTFKAIEGEGASFSFGSLEWVSSDKKYSVRSPVAVTWIK